MRHRHGEEALVLVLLSVLGACTDPVSRAVAPAASSDVVATATSGQSTEERSALSKIARLVAMSMSTEPARQALKRDLRAAMFREHKVELASYLRSNAGRALLTRMAAANRSDETAVLNTLNAIRHLELYMPVASQRESWTGKANVLVASQLDESEAIVAFDEQGRETAVDRRAPPSRPTLSIVPVETRFDQPMDPRASRNVRDQNGESIGTLESVGLRPSNLIACSDTCGGGGSGGSTAPIPPGLYLEFSRIVDAKEPWTRGDPEIEVHIHGPTSADAPRYGENLSCSGEHAADYRKVFDQNGGFWEGRVLLFSNEETVDYVNKFKDGFHVIFWEDDNEPCTLKFDGNTLVTLVQSTAGAAGAVAVKLIPGAPWYVVAGLFIAQLFSNSGSWLLTNDDFLGIAVDQRQLGSPYPTNTHVIMDGTTLNGRATIVYR
ncbi:MAG TPA: hypothetical protein VJ840_18190 [Gemmatimonadaceae bacterium]|nr:hypothetical protein [Gemmatimonadaceae bacterium]